MVVMFVFFYNRLESVLNPPYVVCLKFSRIMDGGWSTFGLEKIFVRF
jgi:hypothetical protein